RDKLVTGVQTCALPILHAFDELAQLVARMQLLMRDANGIGLAATQVGILKRLFVFVPAGEEAVAVANPEIVERSDEVETDDEGRSEERRVGKEWRTVGA